MLSGLPEAVRLTKQQNISDTVQNYRTRNSAAQSGLKAVFRGYWVVPCVFFGMTFIDIMR
jgi:hypothetical protein